MSELLSARRELRFPRLLDDLNDFFVGAESIERPAVQEQGQFPIRVSGQLQHFLHCETGVVLGVVHHAALVVEQHGLALCDRISRPIGNLGVVWVAGARKRRPGGAHFLLQRVGFGHLRYQRARRLDVVEHEWEFNSVPRPQMAAAFRRLPIEAIDPGGSGCLQRLAFGRLLRVCSARMVARDEDVQIPRGNVGERLPERPRGRNPFDDS